ncbi:copper homeostasis protein CutC [Lentibacillus cibarius]|nr:copper homeostasis protein CutC [Lentibacillus cibarius]
MYMTLEVIVENAKDAKQAEELGADRLELVSAIAEGGLTPSYGTMKQVMASVSIPVQVMIRPHSFHFYYSENDMEVIRGDIEALLELGGNRIVFGALHRDGTVQETLLNDLTQRYPQLDITFHKAFDEVPSLKDAYHTLTAYSANVKRILTSGGKKDCLEGAADLQELVQLASSMNGPSIMPGGGLRAATIADVHQQVAAEQYHFGKAVRIEGQFSNGFDREIMQKVKDVIS